MVAIWGLNERAAKIKRWRRNSPISIKSVVLTWLATKNPLKNRQEPIIVYLRLGGMRKGLEKSLDSKSVSKESTDTFTVSGRVKNGNSRNFV